MPFEVFTEFPKTSWAGPCFCCRRRDDGLLGGNLGEWGRNVKLVLSCNDHIHLARKAVHMAPRNLDRYEQEALRAAGKAAGAYLDSIGKTDLTQLTELEWITFLRTLLDEFGKDLAARLASHQAPF